MGVSVCLFVWIGTAGKIFTAFRSDYNIVLAAGIVCIMTCERSSDYPFSSGIIRVGR